MLAISFRCPRIVPWILLVLSPAFVPASLHAQFIVDTIPGQAYYGAVFEIYRGDYRDAERALRQETRGSIRIGVTDRWIDSICYQAMWGEVLYHEGRLALALDHYNEACNMFLQYPKWLLQVDFQRDPRPDPNLARKVVPWGTSTRQFTLGSLPDRMPIQIGDDLATQSAVVQGGGVLRQLQKWRIDAEEIIRATALAMSRRNELLGPLTKSDPISRDLMNQLSSGIAPPNHWSNAWEDLLLGIAYAGQGNRDQAFARLQRAERLAGTFDHRLTCVALLEQGRLAMEMGKKDLADQLLAEASYSAFYYENPGVIDEAFRLASTNRLGSPHPEPNPALDNAAAWARSERFDHIFARLSFARAEEWMVVGDWQQAATTLQAGQARFASGRAGLLGVWSQYLEARILTELGRPTAAKVLESSIAGEIATSKRSLQVQIANQWFDQRQLRASVADEVYQALLSDPTDADWAFRPLETLAWLQTPLDVSYERWLAALEERKQELRALEVTDLSKRHRFYLSLAMGGRVAALRDTLELDSSLAAPADENLRSDLLRRYPEYRETLDEGRALQAELRRRWQPALTKDAQQELVKLWRRWAENLAARNHILTRLGLSRVPSPLRFPPVLSSEQLQSYLRPGQAVVVFHDTTDGLKGFLVTDRASSSWNCGPSGKISSLLSQFLRDLGNYDRNSVVDDEQLASEEWLKSGQKVFQALFEGSSIDPDSMDELVVVPDGLVWYVPLEALAIKLEDLTVPLSSLSQVRVVPTMGLAFGHATPWRRVQHATIAGRELVPGESDDVRAAALEPLQGVLSNLIELPESAVVASPVVATLLDTLVVLDEFDIDRDAPLGWSPIPGMREGDAGNLAAWLAMPRTGPQRIVFAGAHTIAENGGRTSRRHGHTGPAGNELFLTSCSLMSSGAQTILISRWRVGGQSTLDLIREFVQELPRTSAADAWQRCIELAKELPLKLSLEPRVKVSDESEIPTAAYPFFWAGYLLVDSGEPYVPSKPNDAGAPQDAAKRKSSDDPAVTSRALKPSVN